MNANQILSDAKLLDWNCDPKPSPYQQWAWQRLLSCEASAVLPVLESMEKQQSKNGYCPFSYAHAWQRCKASNTTNL
jgi:hypothetical protein